MEKSDAWRLTDDLHLQHGQADPFSAAIRSSRMSMVIVDPKQRDYPIIFANDAFLRLTGYARDEVTGRNCRFLQGPETDTAAIAAIRQALAAVQDIAIDILNYRKDGSTFWNSLYLSPVFDKDGVAQYFFGSQFDVTERKMHEFNAAALQQKLEHLVKQRTLELETALERSTMLLHEVDHRVKNNLQMISAILMLQSMSVTDVTVKAALQETLERVDALGLVHKRLYQSGDTVNFDISAFAEDIAQNLVLASGRDDIDLNLHLEPVKIRADQAASMAIIINESIAAALKSILADDGSRRLGLAIKPLAGACEVSIWHTAPSMDPQPATINAFGKSLVDTLVKQLRAKLVSLPTDAGTHLCITVPL